MTHAYMNDGHDGHGNATPRCHALWSFQEFVHAHTRLLPCHTPCTTCKRCDGHATCVRTGGRFACSRALRARASCMRRGPVPLHPPARRRGVPSLQAAPAAPCGVWALHARAHEVDVRGFPAHRGCCREVDVGKTLSETEWIGMCRREVRGGGDHDHLRLHAGRAATRTPPGLTACQDAAVVPSCPIHGLQHAACFIHPWT